MKTYLLEIKYEFLRALRTPQYVLPTLLFPIAFYLFYGVMFGARQSGGVRMADYMIATFGSFGVIGASLFGFGVTVAIERGQGWLEAKRTTPMPIAAYFVSKMTMAMAFSAIVVVLLMVAGTTLAHVHLTPAQMVTMFVTLVGGSIPFCALGLAIGFFVAGNSAASIVNLIYLPMAVLSGLWMPISALPAGIRRLAPLLPAYHLSQLALKIIGADRGGAIPMHIGAMLAATLLFCSIAYAGWKRG